MRIAPAIFLCVAGLAFVLLALDLSGDGDAELLGSPVTVRGVGASNPERPRIRPLDAPPNTDEALRMAASSVESESVEALSVPPEATLRELRELERLRLRVSWLEAELLLCGSAEKAGVAHGWLDALLPDERPDDLVVFRIVEAMAPYPVELSPAEGLWLAARITSNDWKTWGATVDEAIIFYLGAARIADAASPDALALLQEDWAEEGYFDR